MTAPPSAGPTATKPTGFGLAALAVSLGCTAWLAVEILLRVNAAPAWMVTASFVIAVLLAVIVVVLAILAWRRGPRAAAVFGFAAVAMAASDRITLVLLTAAGVVPG